jgi:hypothetical protein
MERPYRSRRSAFSSVRVKGVDASQQQAYEMILGRPSPR